MKQSLLFLSHRIPYPPNKGDKIRSWHMLRHLAQRFDVHLGCLIDDPDDWQHVPMLEGLCASTCIVPLRPRLARALSLRALLTGEPLSFPYFRNARLARWVRRLQDARVPDATVAFSSAMAPYAGLGGQRAGGTGPVIVDFVDVDSEKWHQYADMQRGFPGDLLGRLYRREGSRLGLAERRIAAAADLSLFATPDEAALFTGRWPSLQAPVRPWANGVDTGYFDPSQAGASPYPAGGPVLLFTGAMDYIANIDAVTWFADQVFPALRNRRPDLRFCIAGARPAAAVQRLAQRPGIIVTGGVPDLRPYLGHAALAVAPLRVARGIQNKVLEALAMGAPTLVSPGARCGLAAEPGRDLVSADTPAEWIEAVQALLRDAPRRQELGRAGRALVLAQHSWPSQLAQLDRMIDGVLAARALEDLPVRMAEAERPLGWIGGLAEGGLS